jgi:hypothetical protein
MRRIAVTALGAALVAGCAPHLNEELARYKGKPAESLIAVIGVPDNEQNIAGRHLYVWNSANGDATYLECRIRATIDQKSTILTTDAHFMNDEDSCRMYKRELRTARQAEERAARGPSNWKF